MKTFKIELKTLGKSEEEIRKAAMGEVEKQINSFRLTLRRNEAILTLPKLAAEKLGDPSIKTVTDLIDVLAPLSKKYAAKVAGNSVSSGGRSRATPEQVEKAKADLRAGKSVAEVAKDAGKSYGWAHNLKGELDGKSKPKAKKKKKA